MTKKHEKNVVDLARARLADAEKLFAQAEEAVARADEAVTAADPANDAAFEAALHTRSAAIEKRNELKDRLSFAERGVAVAREQAEQSQRAEWRRELDEIESEIREWDGVIDRDAVKFRVELAEVIGEQGVRVMRALELDAKLRQPLNRNRSYWAFVAPGHEMRAAWLSPAVVKASQTAELEARAAAAKPKQG